MVLNRASHEIIVAKAIILVVGSVDVIVTRGNKGDFGLRGLGLLVALIGSTLLTHLLIASGSQGASDLLDFGTWELLHKLACEILGPDSILGLL